jgi:hypothetical protein
VNHYQGAREAGGGLNDPGGGLNDPGGGLNDPGGGLNDPGDALNDPGGDVFADDACVVVPDADAACTGTNPGASWMAEEPADGEGEGESIAEDDGRGAAETGAALVRTSLGAAAAWRPPPSATARAMPIPVRARTATRPATPDRKLVSSMRTFITRLSLAAQPVPSLTTKHDTWVFAVLVGLRGPKPTFRYGAPRAV